MPLRPLALMAIACIALGCERSGAADREDEKLAAAANTPGEKADGALDACSLTGWYGDGECDPFCAEADPDCDLCTLRGWYSDGICDAVCAQADPDCDPSCPEPDAGAPRGFKHPIQSLRVIRTGDPVHSVVEPVVNPGQAAVITARFAYGLRGKPLEDEPVRAFLRTTTCGAWTQLGVKPTNAAGEVAFKVAGTRLAAAGTYDFRVVVDGDGSRVAGAVFVVEPGRAAVVFDIDGTLTTGDAEVWKQVILGLDPAMRPAASEAAGIYAAKGYLPVFLTGRPAVLQLSSRRWLAGHGFPVGPVRVTDWLGETLPMQFSVGCFKSDQLTAWEQDAGLAFLFAYGNATTDICAYADAGIPPGATYVLGPHGGEACGGEGPTVALSGYEGQLASLASLPAVP